MGLACRHGCTCSVLLQSMGSSESSLGLPSWFRGGGLAGVIFIDVTRPTYDIHRQRSVALVGAAEGPIRCRPPASNTGTVPVPCNECMWPWPPPVSGISWLGYAPWLSNWHADTPIILGTGRCSEQQGVFVGIRNRAVRAGGFVRDSPSSLQVDTSLLLVV